MRFYEAPDFEELMFEAEEVITFSITIGTSDPDDDPSNPWGEIF